MIDSHDLTLINRRIAAKHRAAQHNQSNEPLANIKTGKEVCKLQCRDRQTVQAEEKDARQTNRVNKIKRRIKFDVYSIIL
eukprot:scaffold484392_cov23-Prasinocladus_malaysianus.AAC.1